MSSSGLTSASRATASASAVAPRVRLLTTSVLLKTVMAFSGMVWVGFLLGHLGTNAHLFGGPESLNTYYQGIKSNTAGHGAWC